MIDSVRGGCSPHADTRPPATDAPPAAAEAVRPSTAETGGAASLQGNRALVKCKPLISLSFLGDCS